MKLKKKTLKWLGILIIIIIAYLAWKTYNTPTYPDTYTPKALFGNPNAKVKVVEFSDLQCPACRSAQPTVKQIQQQFGDQISFEYLHFPLRQIHPHAQKAAEAAECANDQGKFWEYIDITFNNQESLNRKNMKVFARQIGLDQELFDACLDSGAKKDIVEADFRQGVVKNVRGTPTFFVNDKQVDNWNTGLQTTIETELERS